MKKLSIIALFAFISLTITAQNKSILLGGSFGYNDDETTKTLNFNPYLGYNFNNNWTIGANLGLNSVKTGTADAEQMTQFGPFVRYTKNITDIFGVFGDFGANYITGSGSKSGFNFAITPSVYANIGRAFALTASIGGFGYQSYGVDVAKKTNFNLGFGNDFKLGIMRNFGIK